MWGSWKLRRGGDAITSTSVGIMVENDRVSIAAARPDDDGTMRIIAWESAHLDNAADLESTVTRFVNANQLEGQACRCTLSADDYSLRLVERPPHVPDEELIDATRWSIRDLIEFDIEEAEIAVFTLPKNSSRSGDPRMFVVAARRERIVELATTITNAGLALEAVEIIETTLLALEAHLPEVVAGSAILRVDSKSSLLTLSHQRALYLARNLHVDQVAIETASARAIEADEDAEREALDLLDPLLLEIQRSLDYYESEYGQAPASRLILLPGESEMEPLVSVISDALRPVQVEVFDFERIFATHESVPSDRAVEIGLAASAAISTSDLIGASLIPGFMRATRDGFRLSSVARIAALVAAGVISLYGFEVFQLGKSRSALAIIEADHNALVEQLEAARAEAEASADASDPTEELEALKRLRSARLRMLRDLTDDASGSRRRFSSVLNALAEGDVESIWIERLALERGGDAVLIEGRALSAGDLPLFLRKLGEEEAFEDRRFETFEIGTPEDDTPGLSFRIATTATTGNGEGASP